jgi:hypothetical protein
MSFDRNEYAARLARLGASFDFDIPAATPTPTPAAQGFEDGAYAAHDSDPDNRG